MKGLPEALRALADLCEANGGQLPEVKPSPVRKKASRRTDKPISLAKTIVKKHLYKKP